MRSTRSLACDGVPVRVLPRALRPRLAVLFATGVATALTIAVLILGFATDVQFDAAVDAGLQTRAKFLLSAPELNGGTALRNDPLAEVLSPSGRVVASSSSLAFALGSQSVLLKPEDARLATVGQRAVVDDREVDMLGGALRVRALPMKGGGALVLGSRLREVHEAEARLLLLFGAGTPVLVVGLGAAGWLLARAALRPVATLTAKAAEISAADLGRRLPQTGTGDEIDHLARTLNGMLGRLEATVLREREFVDDAAHELRTPIAVLRGELELAERRASAAPEGVRETLRKASDEAVRLGRLAEDLLVLAKQDRDVSTPKRPVPLLARVQEEAERLGKIHALVLTVGGNEVLVGVDERSLARLLSNLVANADAAGAHRIDIQVSGENGAGVTGQGASAAILHVVDDGPGFPADLLQHAAERFVRGDPARTRGEGGAGLGLAIVGALARAVGGSLRLSNDPVTGGARVEVRLPTAGGPAMYSPLSPKPPPEL